MKMYRLLTEYGATSDKLFTLDDAKTEVDNSDYAIVAVVTPRSNKIVYKKRELREEQ